LRVYLRVKIFFRGKKISSREKKLNFFSARRNFLLARRKFFEKFFYTGKLNPETGIHFLSENLLLI